MRDMKNKKITRKISQGMYVLTTINGGCVVDAISQVSAGEQPLIAVAVMKTNYTNELIKTNKKFAISVLGMDVDMDIVKTFGFNSMRDINKFENGNFDVIDNINIIKDSLGYMLCDVIDIIDNETHTLFIGKMYEGDVYKDCEAMTYSYYQEHKDELLKVKTENGKTAWICNLCGYIYYGEELPDGFMCPICGVSRENFTKK